MNPRSIGSLLLVGMLGCSSGSTDPPTPIQGVVARWGNQARVPTSSTLRALLMPNEDQYFVGGDATSMFRSNDGGATWQQHEHTPFANGGDILSVDGLFLDLAYVGHDGDPVTPLARAWGSADGVNWTAVQTAPQGEPFIAVDLVQPTIFNAPNKAFFLRADGFVRRREGGAGVELDSGHSAPRDLDAVSTGMVVVVGDAYEIRASGSYGDGGTWTDLTVTGMPAPQDLYGVHLLSQAIVFACGENGRVLFTDTGDDLAELLPTPTAATLRSIYFPLTPQHGWAVGDGGAIVKITGTQNPMTLAWTFALTAQTSNTGDDLYEVRFTDNLVGVAVGENGTIRKTVNGGTTWFDPVTGTQGTLEGLNAIDCVAAGDRGLAVGENGTVLRTLNGGVTWTPFATGIPGGQRLRAVGIKRLAPFDGAVICGDGGFVRYNTDVWGVGAWTAPATAPPVQDYYGAVWWGTTSAIVAGNASTISQTTDLANWSATAYAGTATDFRSLCVTSDLLAFAAGSAGVIAGNDLLAPGWAEIVEAPAVGGGVTVLSVDAPAGGNILYLACDDEQFRRVVLPLGAATLENGGAAPGATATNAVAVNGVGNLFLAGNRMWLSSDGGLNWSVSPDHTKREMRAVWRRGPSGEQAWAAGDAGTVLRTDVGGD